MDRNSSKQFFGAEGVPKLYDILPGTVARIQPYGAFVKLNGMKKDGLVHRSQISKAKVEDPSEVLSVGENVFCKVISVEDGGEKVGLSMKLVNQTTGEDLDSNNVQSSMEAQRRKQGFKKEINKIELEAVYNTTCKKCGGKGHMAQDCFHQTGGASYELLPDIDDELENLPAEKEKKKSHKHKKEKKKKKKKKKHKHHTSSSSDSEDERKAKKQRKKKKERKSSSSSSTESERDTRKGRRAKKRSHDDESSSDSDHHRKRHKSHKSHRR